MTDSITKQIAEIKAALAKASPGPWTVSDESEESYTARASVLGSFQVILMAMWPGHTKEQEDEAVRLTYANIALAVLLRNTAEALIEKIEAASNERQIANGRIAGLAVELTAEREKNAALENERRESNGWKKPLGLAKMPCEICGQVEAHLQEAHKYFHSGIKFYADRAEQAESKVAALEQKIKDAQFSLDGSRHAAEASFARAESLEQKLSLAEKEVSRRSEMTDRICREADVVMFQDGEVKNFRAIKLESRLAEALKEIEALKK